MFYDEDVFMINPMKCKKDAKVVVQGSVYFIETTPKKNRFCISSHIYNGIRENKKSFQNDQLSTAFSFQELEKNPQYVPFKYLVHDVAKVADEWEDVLDDFSKRDYLSQSLS